jgi:hypothetical protein
MVPAVVSTETQGGGTVIEPTAITFGAPDWKNSTGISLTTRYASQVSAGDDVVAMVLTKIPAAKITPNTPMTDSAGTLASMTEVSSIAAVKAGGSGYFYFDDEASVLFLYEAGGNAIPTGFSTSNTITYYAYEDLATSGTTCAMALGDLRPGDYVTFDAGSNYVKQVANLYTSYGGASGDSYAADPDFSAAGGTGDDATVAAQLEAHMEQLQFSTVGQVVAVETEPRASLNMVKTMGYSDGNVYHQMPGSATRGYGDAVWQSGGANKAAIIVFLR